MVVVALVAGVLCLAASLWWWRTRRRPVPPTPTPAPPAVVLPSTIATHRFVVTIHYIEPTFEIRIGRESDQPYSCPYVVEATDGFAAIGVALAEFHRDEREASVGWVRTIVAVTSAELPTTPTNDGQGGLRS